MGRYFIKFSYRGTLYRGAAKSFRNDLVRDCDSIQGSLETALSTLLPKCIIPPAVTLSSRTDAGVHAICSGAHVDLENKYNWIYNPDNALRHANRYFMKCNHSIRLLEFIPVKDEFHARYFAKSRTYIYRFMIAKDYNDHRIPMMELNQCFHLRAKDFDIERVRRATQLFMGTKDFTTFTPKTKSTKKIVYVRALHELTVEKGQPLMPNDPRSENFNFWQITCTARSFLYNQVRRIVGALLALGAGIITERDINIMLQVPSPCSWNSRVIPVPADGLYLVNVEFDQSEVDNHTIKIDPDYWESDQIHKRMDHVLSEHP